MFLKTFGISPQAYRIRRRMSRAMELMTSSPLSLKEIGFELGFKHQSHFSALFRKTYGVSAREMIKKIRQGMVYRED
jgi:AraC-like DNA-binding protein